MCAKCPCAEAFKLPSKLCSLPEYPCVVCSDMISVPRSLLMVLFVSQQYLSRVFTEFMNCSVYEYLTNYRINKAKELLLINRRRKVQDIASDVGYSDASHFIVMFRKLTGMTPAQFRKLHI